MWVRKDDGEADGERIVNLGGKNTAAMRAGERIIIMTPGGGGWGCKGEEKEELNEVWEKDPKAAWRGGSVASRAAIQESN